VKQISLQPMAAVQVFNSTASSIVSHQCDPIVRQYCWPPVSSGQPTCPEHLAEMCVSCDECKDRAKPQLFKARMVANNRFYIETPDDGNCMFYAVSAAYRSHMMKLGSDKLTLYRKGVNGLVYRNGAARIIKDKMNGIITANTQALPDIDWETLFLGETVAQNRSKEQYLQDLATHAQPGQRGSRYWGGEAALAALAVITNARLVVYTATGEEPTDSLLHLTTPRTWDGVELTIWFNRDDGTGRGGSHYDAFTEEDGPNPVIHNSW